MFRQISLGFPLYLWAPLGTSTTTCVTPSPSHHCGLLCVGSSQSHSSPRHPKRLISIWHQRTEAKFWPQNRAQSVCQGCLYPRYPIQPVFLHPIKVLLIMSHWLPNPPVGSSSPWAPLALGDGFPPCYNSLE